MRIKELREAAGLSPAALGLRVGVSRQAVRKWETGESWPSAQLLPRLAFALGCQVSDLFEPAELAEWSDTDTKQE